MTPEAEAGLRSYRISGLDVASEMALPGAIPARDAASPADVVIRRAMGVEPPDAPASQGPNWAMTQDVFFLRVPRVARFLITGGRRIDMLVEPGVEEADALIFLLGSAFGILLFQRGEVVLHASAVLVGGKAVLFCGRSGAGKSTLAAALNARGYPLVNDDLCRLDFDGEGRALIQPDGRMGKLWLDVIEHLGVNDRKGPVVRGRIDKHYVEPLGDAVEAAAPIGAVYALREQRPPLERGIEVPSLLDAAQLLRRNLYRGRLLSGMGLNSAFFTKAVALQRQVGVYRLTRPFDLSVMPDIVDRLEAHWRTLGLLDAAT